MKRLLYPSPKGANLFSGFPVGLKLLRRFSVANRVGEIVEQPQAAWGYGVPPLLQGIACFGLSISRRR